MFAALRTIIDNLATSTSNEIRAVAGVLTGVLDHLESATTAPAPDVSSPEPETATPPADVPTPTGEESVPAT